ncbi:MAG TPA: hypothetical protein VGH74_15320, partial [Planctomycetaceae bacterium]
ATLPEVTSQLRSRIVDTLVAQMNASGKEYKWYQFRLAEGLGKLNVVQNQDKRPFVPQALARVLVDTDRPWLVRSEAAQSLGRLPYDSNLDVGLLAYEIARLAQQMTEAYNKQPSLAIWKLCFMKVYGAFKPLEDDDSSKQKRGLLAQVESRPVLSTYKKTVQESFDLVLPLVVKVVGDDKEVDVLLANLKKWLDQNTPKNFKIHEGEDPIISKPGTANRIPDGDQASPAAQPVSARGRPQTPAPACMASEYQSTRRGGIMRAMVTGGLTWCFVWLAGLVTPASAQILIWSLPQEEGAWIRLEGTYRQTRDRPNSNAGAEVLEWHSELTISSVGREMADVDGSDVACRWVEFKSLTKPGGVDQSPGPGDMFIYKVLIPEDRVVGKTTDEESLPITFLPIVKGFRRVGQREVEPVQEKALAVFPTIALVTYYPDLQAATEEAEPLQIAGNPVAVKLFKGTRHLKRSTTRSGNVASLWRSDEVPFGLARFQVALTVEQKDLTASDDEFQRSSLTEVDLAAVAVGNDAR